MERGVERDEIGVGGERESGESNETREEREASERGERREEREERQKGGERREREERGFHGRHFTGGLESQSKSLTSWESLPCCVWTEEALRFGTPGGNVFSNAAVFFK